MFLLPCHQEARYRHPSLSAGVRVILHTRLPISHELLALALAAANTIARGTRWPSPTEHGVSGPTTEEPLSLDSLNIDAGDDADADADFDEPFSDSDDDF